MDNKLLVGEAYRIANKLIIIKESDKDLDTLFNELLDKNFNNKSSQILFYITGALANEKYSIESISPFKLKKNNS